MPHGPFWEIAAGAFGVAAAILLVGGWILLRYQRDRQHFLLMQSALEKGITSLPGAVAGWVVSLRQGVLSLVLGLALAASGYTLYATANAIDPAPQDANPAGMNGNNHAAPPGPPVPRDEQGMGGPPDGPPMRPGPRAGGAGGGPPEMQGPPRMSPSMERWQRIQTQRLTGLIAICAGGILGLLGLVRILFSGMERKYVQDAGK